ncbi:hypothetical protein PSOLE_33250 [Pseudomonas oleovorans subsp. oleovorans]|uniref:Uncharacterized protein n=1 Tax=Ectopseudomonas oleovorans TaxID=301 RepID=A0A379PLV5_ECTOL|nr:hypothetical protein [Pseudomonas oleovorans]MBI6902648.1 hypothetical protein [Pseudomonas aeruginosa]OWK41566.1 hypothetical protein PSOLE_33250 [Pseudomonas oleovorans subsp. oleovorans]SEJ35027.1 hypothetical protein SAMN05216280_101949 [Pseudomonas oleovorans]SUE72362.1 Uncharacterised protein [Pseudomonas oleovorans]SUE72804.1 Uncharacterised protein [Pseudomonas oleovorans]
MKDVVQIKAELFEGQHDALIAFYETYPRLFVNKLLLRLCEAFMPTYKPNLSFFRPHPATPGAKSRKIAIRVDKDLCPMFWQFYKELPYGSRVLVAINLMNHYVQMVEGDRQMLEQVYWKGTMEDLPAVASVQEAQREAQPLEPLAEGNLQAVPPDNSSSDDDAALAPSPTIDPLSAVHVGL